MKHGKFNKMMAAVIVISEYIRTGELKDVHAAIDEALSRTTPNVRFVRTSPEAKLPVRGTEGAVGYDITSVENVLLMPGERRLIDTGWKIAVNEGYEIQVRPRSGLAVKHGITVLNTPGTVDPDYRGMMGIILINHDREKPFQINVGDRIAQIVVAPVCLGHLVEVESFEDTTERGEGGYGSTGMN